MGGLFSRSKKPFRILMVGLDGAGKTTCLYQLKMGQSVPTIPTVGFNVETVRYRGSMFSVCDVGGQDKLRNLWQHYYAEADGIIFMIDSSDRERLKEAKAELYGLMSDPMAHRAVVLVLGNKVDVKGAIKPDELVQSLELGRCHPTRSTHVMSCCGKTGQGLREGLDWLITKLERPKPQKLKPTKQSSKSKSKSHPHIATPTKTSFST